MDAILFDMDGTLIDSNDAHAEAWREIFLRYGKDIPASAIRTQIGKGGDQLVPVFLSADEQASFGEEMQKRRSALVRERYIPSFRPFPGVRELFQRILQDGVRIAIATSAAGPELDSYLEIAGIRDLPVGRVTADDAERSKPHPDIFLAAWKKLGAPKERTLVVGDSPYDAEGAERAGLPFLGVRCGGFPEESLRRGTCKGIVDDPADLLVRYDEIKKIIGS
jgi:HAD superfamily hydrolase (TIGR01509 family)